MELLICISQLFLLIFKVYTLRSKAEKWLCLASVLFHSIRHSHIIPDVVLRGHLRHWKHRIPRALREQCSVHRGCLVKLLTWIKQKNSLQPVTKQELGPTWHSPVSAWSATFCSGLSATALIHFFILNNLYSDTVYITKAYPWALAGFNKCTYPSTTHQPYQHTCAYIKIMWCVCVCVVSVDVEA